MPVLVSQAGQIGAQLFDAEVQAAREALVKQQELGNPPGVDRPGVEPAIGAFTRDRAQHALPLDIVEARSDPGQRGQQHIVLHVEDPRGAVAALNEGPDPGEIVVLVAQHGAIESAAHLRRLAADRGEHLAQRAFAHRPGERVLQHHPGFVDRFPDLAGQRGADRTGIGPRSLNLGQHRSGVGLVAQQVVPHAFAGIVGAIGGFIGSALAQRGDDRLPLFLRHRGIAGQRHAEARLDQPRGILRTLEVAGHPVSPVGGPA